MQRRSLLQQANGSVRFDRSATEGAAAAIAALPTDGICVMEPEGTGVNDALPNLNPEPIKVECSIDVDRWLE